MATRRKASRRKIKKSPFLGLLCLGLLLCASMAATIYLIFLRPGTHTQSEEKQVSLSAKIQQEEIIQPASPPTQEKVASPRPNPVEVQPEGPQVAIIIDDLGAQKKIGEKFLNLDLDLSFSILPHLPHGLTLARKAQAKGRDVLLHLPMEPTDLKWDPGPGALFLKMDEKTMHETLVKNIAAVPMAIGINNHMGSRYSENSVAMKALLTEIKTRNLFFVDSLTSPKSVGYKQAQEIGVKTAKRNVFLDNDKDPDKIVKQLEKLMRIAQKTGSAIGIGHPYPATLEALKTALPRLKKEVLVTAVHNLVE